jgi:hypothetical protein
MSNSQIQTATQKTGINESGVSKIAQLMDVSPSSAIEVLRETCFPNGKATNAQLAAFVSVCNNLGMNPMLPGIIYAYPSNGGIKVMLGPDGVNKLLAENPHYRGRKCTFTDDQNGNPVACTSSIFMSNLDHPVEYTAYLSEWTIPSNPNWKTRPRHMLEIRATKMAARQIIHGLPMDKEEFEIIEHQEPKKQLPSNQTMAQRLIESITVPDESDTPEPIDTFNEGWEAWEAYGSDQALSENPHAPDSDSFNRWQDGWEAAAKAAKE